MRLLALAASFVALLFGAQAAATKPKVDSGIRGEATAGPTCPVERYPPDPQCKDRPYQATVKVRRKRTGAFVKKFTAHSDGTFKVRLKPGTYTLQPQPGKNGFPWARDQDVKVHAHKFAHVHLEYDTGIR